MEDGEICTRWICTPCHWTVQIKMLKIVCFTFYDFHHNLKKKKKHKIENNLGFGVNPRSKLEFSNINSMTSYKVFFILQTFFEYHRPLSSMGVRNTDPLSSSKSVHNFIVWDFPGGTVECPGWRHRFNPLFGKNPQASEQLSMCGTATEPVF